MTEIQCTSCHTRYRIDERVLPEDTPTFKCSRCGHVFNADPIPASRKSGASTPASERAAPSRDARSRPNPSASPAKPAATPTATEEALRAAQDLRAEEALREAARKSKADPQQSATLPRADFDDVPNSELGHHPLDRTFGDREKADTGENLRFDFSREDFSRDDRGVEPPPLETADAPENERDRWQIGETTPEFETARDDRAKEISSRPDRSAKLAPPPQFVNSKFRDRSAIPKTVDYSSGDLPEDVAEIVGRVHSSGFFLALYLVVAIVFLIASYLISGDPVASARLLSQTPRIGEYFASPVLPAMLVSLRDVHSEYRVLKGGNRALVVSGTAQNVGNHPLHLVQIDADLFDGGAERTLAHQNVYCGNVLSAEMLAQMTPREIEFSQSLSPQKAFSMAPSVGVPFLMVFINPPQPVNALRLSVAKAIAAEPSSPVEMPSPR